jgi:PAS domain S-box-containing protein
MSIRRKQMLILMLTSSVALLLACAAFVAYDTITFRQQLVKKESTVANVIGNTVTAAIDFNDAKTAEESLGALRAEPNIVVACIYDGGGKVFVTYHRDRLSKVNVFPAVQAEGHDFAGNQLHLFLTIKQGGGNVGTIFVASDLDELSQRLTRYAGIMGLVFATSLLVALALSSRLQRVVSDPILHLAQTARSVALDKDYSVRAKQQSSDELGQLIDGFNEMLNQIQHRDAALQAARENLEQRVEERTSELAESLSVLNATLGSTADGILVVNSQGKQIFRNQRTIELWKIPPDVSEGSDDAAQVRHVANATTNPEQFLEKIMHFYSHPDESGQDEIKLKDGTILERITAPVLGKDGRNYGRIWTFRDVTQSRQAEAELAYERDLLRTLLDNSIDQIFFKDAQSRFTLVGTAQARQFGVAAPEVLIGKSDFNFYPEEYARSTFDDEQTIIRTGQPMIGKIEKLVQNEGRGESWALTTKMPLRNKTDEIIGTFGISKDITAIKAAEAQLQEVHNRLLETSRQAGMAEVATNVLHNVGNVLNSVNVSTAMLLDNNRNSKIPYLGKVVTLLNEHATDLSEFMATDPKGRQLPGYLGQLAQLLAREQQKAEKELELLLQNIDHIKDIVAMQQSYATISGVTETIKVCDLVEDALRMNASTLARHAVEIVREYTDLPPVNIEKHKVLQILVNLIRNAEYACDDSGRKDKQMKIRLSKTEARIQIAVIDNGVGIPPENLTHIFNHGFTTRKGGHGFGLHSGALAAKELGGSLTAHSNGPGTGATFVLELSLRPKDCVLAADVRKWDADGGSGVRPDIFPSSKPLSPQADRADGSARAAG